VARENQLNRPEWSSFLKALRNHYGRVARPSRQNALDSLISTILSQSTTDLLSHQTFSSLKSSYPCWGDALRAGPSEIQKRIRRGGLSKQKAQRIYALLSQLEAHFGSPSLKRLDSMPRKQAWEFLLSFEGIGPKTAACVLLFACDRSAFPIDTHVSRVCHRVGLLPKHTATAKDHERMRILIPRKQQYAAHILMVRHGRLLCRPTDPSCWECPVLPWCTYSSPPARKLLTA